MFLTLIALTTMLLLSPSNTNDAKMQQYPRLHAAARQDRILIIAPHIDDESIGAGGFAIDSLANGAEVYVVFLTAGDCSRFAARLMHKTLEPTASNYLSVGRARIDEAGVAMKLLGIPQDHYFVLGSTPERALLPPTKMKSFSWATYTLSDRVQRMKTSLLMTYKSQRPYVFLLRNAFVRRNELFYVYPSSTTM